MSFNLNNGIPESDLPVKSPSGAARVRYVDGDGKSYSSAMPDVIAASALVQDAIDGVVANAVEEIGIVVNGLGYLPPVAFTGGLNVDSSRFAVTYSGVTYAPVADAVPFTTTSTFNPSQWRVIQGVTSADLASAGGAELVGFKQAGDGAVDRSVLRKLRESVSVLDFIPESEHAAIRAYTSTYDCTAGIQAAIDYAMYGGGRCKVRIPSGKYRTTDTIQLGYGDSFKSVVVEGDGYNYRGESSFDGVTIVADFSDRPAFNFQGARGSILRGIGIIGKLSDHIVNNNMGSNTAPLVDDTIEASWYDPLLAPTQDSRYAPYAAITIDAYSGSRPVTSYPDVNYPAFLGTVPQYGKTFSSDVLIDDVYIRGFTVAIANQPCDADGNGDFTTIRRCYIEQCKWGISVGNTQSRNVHIQAVKASRVYSVLTNRRHGRQTGKFGGAVIDLTIFGAINLIDFGGFYSQPMTFINLYAESLWRIGTIAATSTNENTTAFISCEFSFGGQTNARGVPASVLDGAQQQIDMRFNGCYFREYPSVVPLYQNGISFTGCFFRKDSRSSDFEKFAHNFLAGGLVTPNLSKPRESDIKCKFFNLDTGALESNCEFTKLWGRGERKNCIPLYAQDVKSTSEAYDSFVNMAPYFGGSVSKSSLVSSTLNGKELVIQFSSRSEVMFNYLGPLPGDVMMDDITGSVFFVKSRTGTTVVAELQNNYKDNGSGGFTTITAIPMNAGNFYFKNSRIYTPTYYLRGDLNAGSAVITNCGRDDGFAAWYDAQISAGDWLAVAETRDRFASPSVSQISSRDQAAGTITLTGSAGVLTATRKRLQFFIRQPPANV